MISHHVSDSYTMGNIADIPRLCQLATAACMNNLKDGRDQSILSSFYWTSPILGMLLQDVTNTTVRHTLNALVTSS